MARVHFIRSHSSQCSLMKNPASLFLTLLLLSPAHAEPNRVDTSSVPGFCTILDPVQAKSLLGPRALSVDEEPLSCSYLLMDFKAPAGADNMRTVGLDAIMVTSDLLAASDTGDAAGVADQLNALNRHWVLAPLESEEGILLSHTGEFDSLIVVVPNLRAHGAGVRPNAEAIIGIVSLSDHTRPAEERIALLRPLATALAKALADAVAP